MGLSDVRGQDQALRLLRSAHKAGRLSHAYLFRGPDGVGKETTALEFAKALNCEAGALEGCDDCRPCRMMDRLSHPDVHLIFPLPRDLKPDQAAELKMEYVRTGYREQDFKKAAIISVETILRDVVVEANRRPYIGPRKIFILADADKMTAEAANTLLKTLEEPPGDTVIILTSSRPSALPVTVVSRCQKIRFVRLSHETIEEILVAKLGFERERARACSALAHGSVGLAARMKGGLTAELDNVAAIVGGERMRDPVSLMNEADKLAFRLGRDQQQRVLDLMLLWYRDVLMMAEFGQIEGRNQPAMPELLYSRHIGQLRAQATSMEFADIEGLIRRIDEARRAVERYSNSSIVFTSVLLSMAIARKRSQA